MKCVKGPDDKSNQMRMTTDYMKNLHPRFVLNPSATALLIVDMQYATASRAHGLGQKLVSGLGKHYLDYRFTRIETIVVPAIQSLARCFRDLDRPVVYLVLGSMRHDFTDLSPHLRSFSAWIGNRVGSKTHDILGEVAPQQGDIVLRKTSIGGFGSSGLDATLRALGVTELVLTGVSTSYCVDQTAKEAVERGYRVVIVEDGVAENSAEWHQLSLEIFARVFGHVSDSRAILHEMSGKD